MDKERLEEVETELKQSNSIYVNLMNRVYDKNSPKDIRDIVYCLLYGKKDPRKIKRINRVVEKIKNLYIERFKLTCPPDGGKDRSIDSFIESQG